MPRNSPGREVSLRKLRLSERQISPHPDKGCGSLPARRYDLQAGNPPRPRSASLGSDRFLERRPVQEHVEVLDGITDGKNSSIPKKRQRNRYSLVHRQEHAASGLLPVADHLDYQRLRGEIMALEARLAEAEKARQRELARLRGDAIKRSATERAKDLLAGGRIDPTPAAQAAQALEQETWVLRAAVGEKTREIDRLVADLSWDAANSVKPEFDNALKRALQAMYDLSSAFRDAAHVTDGLHKLGYRPPTMLLNSLTPAPCFQLGDPDAVGMSEAWRFKPAFPK
jgi:hypothetical protein